MLRRGTDEGAPAAGPPGARVPTASSDFARGVVVMSPVVPPVSLSPLSVPDVPADPAEPDAPPEPDVPPEPALPLDFEPLLSWACTETKVGRLKAKVKAVVTSSLRIWNLLWPVSRRRDQRAWLGALGVRRGRGKKAVDGRFRGSCDLFRGMDHAPACTSGGTRTAACVSRKSGRRSARPISMGARTRTEEDGHPLRRHENGPTAVATWTAATGESTLRCDRHGAGQARESSG